jgi:hypothetical protein
LVPKLELARGILWRRVLHVWFSKAWRVDAVGRRRFCSIYRGGRLRFRIGRSRRPKPDLPDLGKEWSTGIITVAKHKLGGRHHAAQPSGKP